MKNVQFDSEKLEISQEPERLLNPTNDSKSTYLINESM